MGNTHKLYHNNTLSQNLI